MRGMIGVLTFAVLVVGCGNGLEEAPDDATLPAGPPESREEVTAMAMCRNNQVHYAQYFHINGVECGLAYHYCDGRIVESGCTGVTFTEYWFCGCP